MRNFFYKTLLAWLFLIGGVSLIQAQRIFVYGVVKDSVTNEPIPYATLQFQHSAIGTVTAENGVFEMDANLHNPTLVVSYLGYETKHVVLPANNTSHSLNILLQPTSLQLNEVVVKPKRERYTRKNNPTVELIRNVIARKDSNYIQSKNNYKAEHYEKLALSLDGLDTNFEKNKFAKQFKFLQNHFDTSSITGKRILTLSLREKLSDVYYRQAPKAYKKITKAQKQQGIDKTLDNFGTISANLEEILKEVNIYDNDINFMLNRFVSPLSSTLATTYYHYYIMDTIWVKDEPCVDLAFVPVNPQSYAFSGRLYITLDGSYAVKRATLFSPRQINLNYVKSLRIEQDFTRLNSGSWALSTEQTDAVFYFLEGGQQLYANQLKSYNQYNTQVDPNDAVFGLLGDFHTQLSPDAHNESFWKSHRHVALHSAEHGIKELLNKLNEIPLFKILIRSIEVLVASYVPIDPRHDKNLIDLGPMNTSISSNHLEGLRLRMGASTTANLLPHLFANGYVAYGFRDQQLKYRTKLTYSFNDKKYHEMESPLNNLSLMHEYDLYTPGQDFHFTDKDNMFVAVKIGKAITKMNYIRRTSVQYDKEWMNGFSFKSWVQHQSNQPTGSLQYTLIDHLGQLTELPKINTTEAGIKLRYAPGETPFNSRAGKESVFNLTGDVPILKISHQTGMKGVLGGQYAYNRTEAGVEKKIWLSSFGHINTSLKAGKVWNKVPFPLLIMPNTNQSITIQPASFHLMNALEFVADQYVQIDATYYLKGLLFNRIPYLNQLGIREVVSFSGVYGSLSDKNNPKHSTGLFLLPDDTYSLTNKPYMEFSFGLENIFRILQVNYYRRLSYLHHPDIQKNGFRIALRFSF